MNRPQTPLYRFHGGLTLTEHTREAVRNPVVECPTPPQLIVALTQHAGEPAQCVVTPGQRVRRGELLAHAVGDRSASIHAPSSGTVSEIDRRVTAGADNAMTMCVVIETDSHDEHVLLPVLADWHSTAPEALRERIAAAGIVGLGGAAFPTAMKLATRVDTLILNGAECEPYIACDEALLREHAGDVIDGARLLQHVCGAQRVLLALEDRMSAALAALRQVLDGAPAAALELVQVPTIYPAGGERQLIRVLTGREVPSGGLPRDVGVVCVNVATAAASWRAVVHGESLTQRIVTVSGRGVQRPGNFRVRIGTSVAQLVEAAGGYTEAAARLVMGGPMMGVALPHDAVPVVKATNCVLVLGREDVREPAPELPCIRCGECAQVCPAQLLPQQLLMQLKTDDFDAAGRHGLFDCIECGLCAFVCPSQIPLVDWYRDGKSELRAHRDALQRADRARDRHIARGSRLARDAAERVARVSARAQEREASSADEAAVLGSPAPVQVGMSTPDPAPTATPMDKAAVLAAIARGKARRHTQRADVENTSADDSKSTPSPPNPSLEGEG